MTGSLAYRKNEAAIIAGNVPDKYTRILPYVTGQRIIEIGSAEGVLALLLARQGKHVIAVEKNKERHTAAEQLYATWAAREGGFTAPMFVNDRIADRQDLFEGADTLLAVRSIYYLGAQLDPVFAAAATAGVKGIVLCGNKNRAACWRDGRPHEPLGDFNRYAASEGMIELVERHGYIVTEVVTEGDEIVVAQLG